MIHKPKIFILVACLLIGLFLAHKSVVARFQTSIKSGTAVVNGVVTVEGKPAPSITVVIARCEGGPPRKYPSPATAKTNDDGQFHFDSLAAGRYCVNAFAPGWAPGFAASDYQKYMFNLSDGETVDGIALPLVKGGVITGRVTGSDGRPAIEEWVQVYPRMNGRDFSAQVMTDDRGVYRIYGIPTGSYIVSAGSTGSEEGSRVMGLHLRTYYPNVTDEKQAKLVDVVAGQESIDINIVCGRAPGTYSASGTVVDAGTGLPISNARLACLRVISGSGPTDRMFVQPSNEKGEFLLNGLSAGRYLMRLGFTDGLDAYSEDAAFEIGTEDVSGLVVKALPSPDISGFVTLEGDSSPALRSRLFELTLFTVSVELNEHDPTHLPSRINPDGTFKITGLRPGKVSIELYPSVAPSFVLIRTERGGTTITGGLDLQKGEPINDVRLVFGYANGSVKGDVRLEGIKKPVADEILIQLRSIERPESGHQWAHLDARNHFSISHLLPGRYEVAVHEFLVTTTGNVRMLVSSEPQIVDITNDSESTVVLTATIKPFRENDRQ